MDRSRVLRLYASSVPNCFNAFLRLRIAAPISAFVEAASKSASLRPSNMLTICKAWFSIRIIRSCRLLAPWSELPNGWMSLVSERMFSSTPLDGLSEASTLLSQSIVVVVGTSPVVQVVLGREDFRGILTAKSSGHTDSPESLDALLLESSAGCAGSADSAVFGDLGPCAFPEGITLRLAASIANLCSLLLIRKARLLFGVVWV